MTSILERRKSLHRQLEQVQRHSESLSGQIDHLAGLASVGTAAAMIAHEINNLLTPVGSYAQLALHHLDDKELAKKALQRAYENCQKAGQVVEAILNVSNAGCDEKEDINLASLVDQVFDCLCRDFGKDGITVKCDIPQDLTIYTMGVKLQQVIMNLIINARDALLESRGGILTIKARRCEQSAKMTISDTGCGIEKKNIKRVFEPFFTTKSSSESQGGSGLGLAFCKRIVEQHGGTISVESEPQKGCTFMIVLPSRQ